MSYVKVWLTVACCVACLAGNLLAGHGEVQAESSLVDLIVGPEVEQKAPKGLEKYEKLWQENTIVCFGAKWCGWCPAQKAVIRLLEKKGYTVAIFDVDEDPKIYEYLKGKTKAVPLTVIFVDGEVKERYVGLTTAAKIKRSAKECKINVSKT